ncbi:ABC transporter substrate-binding protein [Balneolales bacterium ANBcel1]|nr:ABC transporter substrate-binding protein [Balneolales bacterium ANBcel1]
MRTHRPGRCFAILLSILYLLSPGFIEVQAAGGTALQDDRFDTALAFYREAEYDSSARHFAAIGTPEARLFAGKSYFALGEYPLAGRYLRQVSREDDPRFFDEARYTLALVDFQTKQFGRALDNLHNLKSRPAYQNLHRDADVMYRQIMGYLTTEQRREAFRQSQLMPVQFDLFRYGIDHMGRTEARELYSTLSPFFETSIDTNIIRAVERRIDRMPDEPPASQLFGEAPDGIVYDIGVLLPDAETGSPEWQISRALYNGYHLAAEEFNRRSADKRIRLRHVTTSDTLLTQEAAMTKMAWTYHVDAILGPLFSDSAYRIRDLAEYYGIPVIPPLANADTLNIANPYLYQVNPTFEVRGRAMARFAVNELKLDTLAVITQSNQPVAREAQAFRNEAERLGATVLHYFSENFEARAFEVAHITPWLAGDERFIDEEEYELKPVKGVYLSLTGRGADQLIELILNDLQATRSRATILANEEMAHIELSDARRRYFDIYYSNFFYRDNDRRETYTFQQDFESLTGTRPNNFAHLGYDVANFLFKSLETLQNPARIKPMLRHRPVYEGVITNIGFQGTHINQKLHIMRIERDETVRYKRPPDESDEETQETDNNSE